MKAANATRYEAGLISSLDRLRDVSSDDLEGVWQATFEVLAWLYLCEQAEQQPNEKAYFAHRRGVPGGRALGGLIRLRGLVVHHQVDFQKLAPVPATVGGIPITLGGVPVTVGSQAVWPPRRASDPWPAKQKDERVEMYDAEVAENPLLDPLERACKYLLSR